MPGDPFGNVLALVRRLDRDAAARVRDGYWSARRVWLHAVPAALLLSGVAPVGCRARRTKVGPVADSVSPAPRVPGVPPASAVVRLPPLARLDRDGATKAALVVAWLELLVSSRR